MRVCTLGLSLEVEQDLAEIQEAGSNQICLGTVITKLDLEPRTQMIHICIGTGAQEELYLEEVGREASMVEDKTIGEAEVVARLGMLKEAKCSEIIAQEVVLRIDPEAEDIGRMKVAR